MSTINYKPAPLRLLASSLKIKLLEDVFLNRMINNLLTYSTEADPARYVLPLIDLRQCLQKIVVKLVSSLNKRGIG